MDRYTVTVLPGGRITIPAAIRKRLDLRPGDALIWWMEDRELHFRKAEQGEVIGQDDQHINEEVPSVNSDPQLAEE